MEINPGIEAVGLALYLKESRALVVSDLHIGFEESLARQGVLVPRFHYKDIIDSFEQVFARVKPEIVVLNGDLKHEFGAAGRQEWKDAMRLFDYLSRKKVRVIVVKGNHDPSIGPLARKKGISVVDELCLGSMLVAHGNALPKNRNAGVIIIGHAHPAISLRENARVERFKCFLKGRLGKSVLIVQPSLNPCIEGSDIRSGRQISPLIRNIEGFDVFVVDDAGKKMLCFGKISDLP